MAGAVSKAELQECREEWLKVFFPMYGDSITMQDLTELKQEFVLSIYLQFVKCTLHASLDNMKMIGLTNDTMQKYPEAYEKALLMPRVAQLLSSFFCNHFGDKSFNFQDLVNHKSSRTRHFFNYICRFVRGYNGHMEKMDGIWQKINNKMENLKRTEEMVEKVKAKVEQLQKQKAEDAIQVEQECNYKQELDTQFHQMQEEKVQLRAALEVDKKTVAERKAQFIEANLALVGALEQKNLLRASVMMPEELDEVHKRNQRLQQIQEENVEKKSQLAAMEGVVNNMEQMKGLFTNHIIPQVDELQNQRDQLASIQAGTRETHLTKSCALRNGEKLDHQITMQRQKLCQLEEENNTKKHNFARKKEGLEAELREQRDILEQLKKTGQNHEAEEKALEDETETLQQSLVTLQKEGEDLEQFCDDTHRGFLHALDMHNQVSESSMQMMLQETRKRPNFP